ncbi:MAG: acetyl-CoA carboxylase biotin carboxyl carrier protein [Deltaproteobacteria bacterium]|nr:acetyl-CoA carboxylase biotin carboxyl carrier protein [Deltaproteobacteria bacterium]
MAKKGRDDADQGDKSIVDIARGLAEILSEHHLSELIVETGGTTVTLRRETTVTMAAPMPMPMPVPMQQPFTQHQAAPLGGAPAVAAPAVDDKTHVVTSPFVGTFYRKPNPDSPNYVSLNDKVDKGQVLCIVEAMKLMNEIEADAAGTIVAILVDDGAPVEYGQPLFKIA